MKKQGRRPAQRRGSSPRDVEQLLATLIGCSFEPAEYIAAIEFTGTPITFTNVVCPRPSPVQER